MRKIATKEARSLVNKELEKINERIREDKADPEYYPGYESSNYYTAEGICKVVEDFDLLTNADKDALRKKIHTAHLSHSEIKLLGQK